MSAQSMPQQITINGVQVDVPAGAIAWKHNDPIEDACWIYSDEYLRAIKAEDPSLIVAVPHDGR